ncbi:MAG: ABC transporter ATP-binding protein [Deltaproteobacteria bacterium]|nr:ABC transporter ATP-binding protein [Deltaproteobacteria bacterium]MBW2193672.1 ABC transporter ATP-binding protein [Deltaproteobacteria bacterium]
MAIIEIENLSHCFSNGVYGIEGIHLTIQEGTLVVIGGQNGSGKTTLLRHLNALLLPSSGVVRLNNIPVSENPAKARQMVGMVFQDADSQIIGETVYDDVAFGPENLCLDRGEVEIRVADALRTVGLTTLAHQRPHILSGGEKRRLAIAGVLAMKPRVLVFDEPFSNLDYPGVRQILAQAIALKRAGHTIIVATHDLEKIIAHADHLVIMKEGKVVRNGLPGEVVKEVEGFGVREPCDSRRGMEIASWLS